MIYSYLFVDNLDGHEYTDGLSQLKFSVSNLEKNKSSTDSILVFNNEITGNTLDWLKNTQIEHHLIHLSKTYKTSDKLNPINILVEKINVLSYFDFNKDLVLMDIDTALKKPIPEEFWDSNYAVLDNIEYPIMQWRNLDKVLPLIPWKQFDINFDSSFMMYNTGVIFIPKRFRREICQKAITIVDYLDKNFEPEERHGNKLDEQIALSIVLHDCFGRYNHIKLATGYIHHYWSERQNNIRWWEA